MVGSIWLTEDLAHEKIAKDLFNSTMELLSKEDRTPDEDDAMLYGAHSSRFHFGIDGKTSDLARGEWLIARAYCALKRGTEANSHARKSLKICTENGIRDLPLACAYEVCARAAMISNKPHEMARFRRLAVNAGALISNEADRQRFSSELSSIPEGKIIRGFLADAALRALIDSRPDTEQAIQQLFSAAREESEQRFYVAILDISRSYHDGKAFLNCELSRFWVIRQFAKFLSSVKEDPSQLDEETAEFLRYLQILAYGQFWECAGIQRLLWSLMNIAVGKKYDPRLFLDTHPSTGSLWSSLTRECRVRNLLLGNLINSIYHNVIRNDAVHSNLLIQSGSILSAPSLEGGEDVFSASFETWDRLFQATRILVEVLFRHRSEAEQALIATQPYRVSLPEFGGPFTLTQDDRGYWNAKSE